MSDILERILGQRRLRDVILAGNLEAGPARGTQDMRDARGLRERVFGEAGAPANATGLDDDRMDALCDHLLVRERDTRRLVAACRLLRPRQARRARNCPCCWSSTGRPAASSSAWPLHS